MSASGNNNLVFGPNSLHRPLPLLHVSAGEDEGGAPGGELRGDHETTAAVASRHQHGLMVHPLTARNPTQIYQLICFFFT